MAEMQQNGVDNSISSASGYAVGAVVGFIFCFSAIAVAYQFIKDGCCRSDSSTPVQSVSTNIANNITIPIHSLNPGLNHQNVPTITLQPINEEKDLPPPPPPPTPTFSITFPTPIEVEV